MRDERRKAEREVRRGAEKEVQKHRKGIQEQRIGRREEEKIGSGDGGCLRLVISGSTNGDGWKWYHVVSNTDLLDNTSPAMPNLPKMMGRDRGRGQDRCITREGKKEEKEREG
jgi:hypothetical protein